MYIIPEVNKRIQSDLKNKSKNSLVLDVPAWLILNSMRMESLQFIQLQLQELHNGWRKQQSSRPFLFHNPQTAQKEKKKTATKKKNCE